MTRSIKKPVLLIIMDGWGIRADERYNAVAQAKTPHIDALTRGYPSSLLGASGESVGLPAGQMGNSEVGHLNLGAGRIVYQDYTRINRAIEEGSFFENGVILDVLQRIKKAGGSLHLIGLLSDGGVHSHMEHIYASIRTAKREGISRIFFHALLDGRDTPPTSGDGYMSELLGFLKEEGIGRVATLGGRFYGMDRDNRWKRVKKAYDAMVLGVGEKSTHPLDAIRDGYKKGETDEFVTPTVVTDGDGPVGRIGDGDGIFFINFRADRARELTRAFTSPDFTGFVRESVPRLSGYLTMTQYDETFDLPIAFPPQELRGILGEVISRYPAEQLRIAETEKYAHVTFFFSGGDEDVFPGEERVLIPSPKEVPTYDKKPEMSAHEVQEAVISKIREKKFSLIILNFANPDMVGHTGVMEAAVTAIETVDDCVGSVVREAQEAGYTTLITADHGNTEEMWDYENDEPHTAHTTNPVPFIVVDDAYKGKTVRDGILADVAPTILAIMGIDKPEEMTGTSLFVPRGKVLVMDDEKKVRDIFGLMLAKLDYETLFAKNGEEAIALYREAQNTGRPFDVVIIDLTIKDGMGGKEAMEKLREIDPRIVAILASGFSSDPITTNYKDYGFSGLISKPFGFEEVDGLIQKLMGKK
jgi:2,3-bisphosphoglycerate-independent phosphoglycerate mutase